MAERVTISISGQDEGGKALIRDVIAQLNAASTAEDKAAQGARQLGDAGNRAARDLEGMTATLNRLVVLLGAASIVRFTKEAIDQADAMRDLSQKTGVQVGQLSIFALAAQRAGADTGTLSTGLRGLAKSITDLRSGSTEAVQAFRAIGLTARDLDGLSLDQSVKKIADAMDRYADGAGKSAVAQQLFGRSGTELLPVLHDLAGDGLAKVTAEAEKLGAVMSQDDVDAADAFNDALSDGKNAALGFAREFATSILPPITDFLKLSAELAAKVPTEMKVFIGVLALTTAGALGTAAAIGTLTVAVSALAANPVVAAIAILGTLVGGLTALAAAKRAQEAQDRRELETRSANINRTRELIDAYERERALLSASAGGTKQFEDSKRRLKAITEELIKVSPAFRESLEKEGQSADQAVAATKRLNEERIKQLEFQELVTAIEIDQTRTALEQAKAEQARAVTQGRNFDAVSAKVAQLTDNLDRATKRQEDLNAAIARARGLEAPAASVGGTPKPDIVLPDPALLAARLAAEKQALEAERALFAEKQKLDEQRNEQAFARGLRGLTQYFAERRAILTENIDAEFLALQKQKQILEQAPATTQADQVAKRTAIAELDAKIAQNRVAETRQREQLDEEERQKQIQFAQQLLSFEATILQARGRTHEATLAQIDEQLQRYQLALQQQGTLSADAIKRLVENARQALTTRADFEQVQQDAERVFDALDVARQRIDTKVRAGALSELGGQRAIAEAERARIPDLEAIAQRYAAIARASGDPALIQAAEALTARIQSLGIITDEVRQRFVNLGTDIRRSLQADLADFLGRGLNDVFSDSARRSDLKALEEQARRAREELQQLQAGDLSPEARESVKKLKTEIADMDRQIQQSKDDTVTWGDAFLELAKNAIGSIQQILGELIAAEIFQRIGALFGRDQGDAAAQTARAAGALGAAGAVVGAGAGRTQAAAGSLGAAGAVVGRSASALGTSAGALDGAGGILLAAARALQAAGAALAAAGSSQLVNGIAAGLASAPGALGFASGGLVRGPGSTTSDSIQAYLSDWEYVVKASQTQRWLPVLDAINTDRIHSISDLVAVAQQGIREPVLRPFDRIPRFANGGIVLPERSSAPGGGSFEGSVSARLELSPDLVPREIKTSRGVEAIFQVLQSNRGLLRALVTSG